MRTEYRDFGREVVQVTDAEAEWRDAGHWASYVWTEQMAVEQLHFEQYPRVSRDEALWVPHTEASCECRSISKQVHECELRAANQNTLSLGTWMERGGELLPRT